ncbi:transferrin receptor-like dimerization domain-containing protein [Pseudemcibacter aquimaris]|uniref:transferrin receptor-like dimerization domain-containing protein n=1 Tax=Pseudemcibacter aquimaris TaxID=2857064 RepID=UPI00201332FD|nr:transferrin receptor-like dimerization domain-containing protein [Pseudemcibacter aquimaris]MCC3862165.1 M28 family peptidase [Pseudemcibacter aquimaris]WDU58918.1 M28 family peptidase [Pseudemcibacter aquimaris]
MGLSNIIKMTAVLAASSVAVNAAEVIRGFTPENSEKQYALEAEIDKRINKQNMDDWMKFMTSRPHATGQPFDKEVADFIAGKFTEWGYDTEIKEYQVLMPTPKVRVVELVEPTKWTAKLKEDAVPEDPTSGQEDRLPIYHSFSPDGEVTAEVVFVNQGLREDYEDLERRGIDVKGKIILAKYGGSWRGIKPKMAEEKGAIGTLIYSDPADDGYGQGDVYPKGAHKHPSGAQRGSIMDLPTRPGDPLTPYVGATKDAERIDLDDVEIFVGIPTLPISYEDAQPILEALEGPVAPPRWRGGLPITYHMGPGPAKLHMKLEFNWDIVPAYNVIAKMKGSEFPDQWVIRGNHHDAWVHGAADPVSGMVVEMEEARILSEIAKETGWQPKRTIVFAAWGAEEQGLIGSVEWVEDQAEELSEKAVAYINTDGNGAGFLGAGGSHTLETFFDQIAHDVKDPIQGMSAAERVQSRNLMSSNPVTRSRAEKSSHYYLSALGSGSDYSGFFQHLGITSMNIGYGGEFGGGSYHTNYDSYHYYTTFRDPGLHYTHALGSVTGRVATRLANADVLPFQFGNFARTVSEYADEMVSAMEKTRADVLRHNMLVNNGHYKAAANIREAFQEPTLREEVPYINLSPMQNAVKRLQASAEAFDTAYKAMGAAGFNLSKSDVNKLDKLMYQIESKLTRPEGLPRRPWYRHHIYAPGYYTGYGVKTLPGVREGIEEYKWQETQEQMAKLAEVLNAYCDQLDQATAMMQ